MESRLPLLESEEAMTKVEKPAMPHLSGSLGTLSLGIDGHVVRKYKSAHVQSQQRLIPVGVQPSVT